MVENPTVVFGPELFLKEIFLPVNSQLGRKSSVFGFLVLYTYYPILDSIIFLVKT